MKLNGQVYEIQYKDDPINEKKREREERERRRDTRKKGRKDGLNIFVKYLIIKNQKMDNTLSLYRRGSDT